MTSSNEGTLFLKRRETAHTAGQSNVFSVVPRIWRRFVLWSGETWYNVKLRMTIFVIIIFDFDATRQLHDAPHGLPPAESGCLLTSRGIRRPWDYRVGYAATKSRHLQAIILRREAYVDSVALYTFNRASARTLVRRPKKSNARVDVVIKRHEQMNQCNEWYNLDFVGPI